MCKFVKTSTVSLCGKSETNCVSTGLQYDETGEKTIYWGHKLSAYNKHWHSSFVFLFSSCGNSHYISLVVDHML